MLPVSVRDARSTPADRRFIESVYREYLDDLAPEDTGIFPALGELGHRENDQLVRWFADPNALPLVILRDARPVGFAMVARGARPGGSPGVDYRMAEFFVGREHRRHGVGRSAVQLILDRFAGRWEVHEYTRNMAAVNFWRRVVARYTGGRYQERMTNGEVRQVFQSGRSATQPV